MKKLTPKQLEIATMVASGMRLAEIARKLDVSGPTVSIHLKGAMKRLGVSDKNELQEALQVSSTPDFGCDQSSGAATWALLPVKPNDRIEAFLLGYCFSAGEISEFYREFLSVASAATLTQNAGAPHA